MWCGALCTPLPCPCRLLAIPYVNGIRSNRTTANVVAAGFSASSTTAKVCATGRAKLSFRAHCPPRSCVQGFNRVVRPLLLSASTAPFVVFDFGMSRMTIRLPPVPGYYPSADETITAVSRGEGGGRHGMHLFARPLHSSPRAIV